MTAQHTYGWADLDTANRQHYGRGKPKELLDAELAMEVAEDQMTKAQDEYYDLHYGEIEYAVKMRRAMQHYQDVVNAYQVLSVKFGYRRAEEFLSVPLDEIKF